MVHSQQMDEIPISKFKATCLSVIEEVRRSGKPVRVTRFGKPLAELVPVSSSAKRADWLGSMVGTAKILGDIIKPVGNQRDWEAFRK